MAKRIKWAPQALADRIQILDYWSKRLGSKEYAIHLDNSIKEVIKLLSEHPQLGRKLEGYEFRFFVKEYYQIFYQVRDDSLIILHLWDSRRNPNDLNL